ncbi:MAG: hypothetical protein IIA88_12690 [Bacteroidetes bacterium]|nr:hypothetical protein [Bacteroidota bacterium]
MGKAPPSGGLGGAYYWKKRLPHPGYWQQDVHYEIKAAIDDKKDIIDATYYKLTYWNNSPHDLDELYFHLYQNTFQPGSYYHDLWLNNNRVPKFGVRYEEKGLGTVIENLKINETPVETELDNTILKVKLNQPLKSGDSLIVTMQFKTYFDQGSMRRRMRRYYFFGNKHYNGVHWYPAICVYDRKFGWTTDQHLDKEFYSDFGTFDVTLTFPHEYIVEATGILQNPGEVMPDTLRKLLDITNFKDTPLNSPPSVIIPKKNNKTKTWIYHAENVHNFAFTADPTYRIGEIEWKGIKIISLAQEPHASKWQRSAEYAAKVIQLYSQDFGMYAWPKIIVADAKDGMEYPMLTLDGGLYPRHKGLLAHEIAHMWFYGMVGNNETYRAFLDEGFAQFLTVWCMDKLERDTISTSPPSGKINHRYNRLYYPYLKNLHEGYDAKLNTHSAAYNGALRHGGGYGLVYYKTGVMLYNLQYVLGDELFLKAMQYYFNKWKFCHPYPEDFRKAIIEYTQTDLNWFFDQWLETSKTIDYAIKKCIKKGSPTPALPEGEGEPTLENPSLSEEKKIKNKYIITFKRKGGMQMPIDFEVTTKDGEKSSFYSDSSKGRLSPEPKK